MGYMANTQPLRDLANALQKGQANIDTSLNELKTKVGGQTELWDGPPKAEWDDLQIKLHDVATKTNQKMTPLYHELKRVADRIDQADEFGRQKLGAK